jgi:pimeloyl-ACP methyl ester carboxylesterase
MITRGRFHALLISRRYSSQRPARRVVPLAYDLHEPGPGAATARRHDRRDEQPILFLHGLFGSKKNNRTISKLLARDLGRPVYALDLRNHGDSPHQHDHDYASMAGDVSNFIHEHGLGTPTLIGHSMGAKTAMTLALMSPELVSDMVAVDNAPLDTALTEEFGHYIRGMMRIEDADITRRTDADEILSQYEESLPIRQFLLGNLHRPQGSDCHKFRIPLPTLAKALGKLGDFPYKDPAEVRFEKPALFIRGTRSKYVPDEVLPLIGQFFPRFRLIDIDAGHWLISEQPDAFRRCECFLAPRCHPFRCLPPTTCTHHRLTHHLSNLSPQPWWNSCFRVKTGRQSESKKNLFPAPVHVLASLAE